jgi:HK97 gp10 family phage protein
MATRVKLTTKGFEPFMEQIAKLGKNLDAVVDRALEAGAEVLLDGMQRRVPKDTHNLEEHLKTDGPHQDGNYHYITIGLMGADAETARYGNAQEYGTSSMAAQPYIRPTLDSDKRKAGAAMKKVFEQELTK